MAVLTLHQPTDMTLVYAWDGDVPVSTPTHIRVTDGYRTQDYFGSFQYDAYGLAGGYVTSAASYEGGRLMMEASGFNLNALRLEQYVTTDGQAALGYMLSGSDELYGSAGNDVLAGYGGGDRLYGREGWDTLVSGTASDYLDGGSGLDVARYEGFSSAYTVSGGAGFKVSNAAGAVDTLVSVERLVFGDGSVLAIDVGKGENTGSAYRLYQAAFDRVPDDEGLAFWIAELDAGQSLLQIAEGFVRSPEFQALYPSQNNEEILNGYYLNVLDRAADQEGFDYWDRQMDNGMSAAEVLMWFSESPENIGNTSGALAQGIWLV